jgi:hypothetical protein
MGVQELETAVLGLNAAQLAEFGQWFSDFRNAKWDAEFSDDAEAGRLDTLAEAAVASFGQSRNRQL